MNLAVLMYQYASNPPEGIPEDWPAEVRELGAGTTLPGANWQLMTTAEYDAYRAARQTAYNEWHEAQLLSQMAPWHKCNGCGALFGDQKSAAAHVAGQSHGHVINVGVIDG